jgi:hypothetical protein
MNLKIVVLSADYLEEVFVPLGTQITQDKTK